MVAMTSGSRVFSAAIKDNKRVKCKFVGSFFEAGVFEKMETLLPNRQQSVTTRHRQSLTDGVV